MRKLRQITFCAFVLLGLAIGRSAPSDTLTVNATARANAIQLFRAGKANQATVSLRSGVKADLRGNDTTVEVAQQLCDIAFYFYSRHEQSLAVQALNESLGEANPLVRSAKTGSYAADLFCNLGLACEKILHDPASSVTYYSAAVTADGTNTQAKGRLEAAKNKQALRAQHK